MLLLSTRLTDLLKGFALLVYLTSFAAGCTYRHRRHSLSPEQTDAGDSDYDPDDGVDEGVNIEEVDGAVRGNGFECDGLNGHHGLFRAFNWTRGELAKISLWHATAQHYKAAELVEQKLAALPADLHHFPQMEVRSFLKRFEAPEATRTLFTQRQLGQIGRLHRKHEVEKIQKIFLKRLVQLEPEVRRQIVQYFGLASRT